MYKQERKNIDTKTVSQSRNPGPTPPLIESLGFNEPTK